MTRMNVAARQPLPPLAKRVPELPPTAEQLRCMHVIREFKPVGQGQHARGFPTTTEIVEILKPHQGAEALTVCEEVGWIERAQSTTQISGLCRGLSVDGKKALELTQYALEELDRRLTEAEDQRAFRKTKLEHTNIPRLKDLRAWLVDPKGGGATDTAKLALAVKPAEK